MIANIVSCLALTQKSLQSPPKTFTFVTGGFGGKIGFDCTHKWPGENGFTRDYPKLITMAPDVVSRIDSLWRKLGL
jgi:4-hydroxy-3-polyprenylbenzoate decarboxylase